MLNLLDFQKPQRYIGNELNVVKKNHLGKISFCLCYPDLYEIGMDNLGLRIIYGLLNSYPDIVCERSFLPGPDLLKFLNDKKKPLFSLETKTPLNKFELVGFNLSYELNYLNFLQMLEAAKIPLENKNRQNSIVVGGGSANPLPLNKFVDVFCLGEFEAISGYFVKVLRKNKDKESRLAALAKNESFYVPQFYNPKSKLKRAKLINLNRGFFPQKWLTPHTKLAQDRIPVEIARGCPNNCNFCQARCLYSPYREKSPAAIVKTIKAAYKKSGYEGFSLLALSASNYSLIEKLLKEITPFARKNKISLNLPSLKIGDSLISIYKNLLSFQKTALTVAIEAGTQALRKKINKNIKIDNLLSQAEALHKLGLRLIKIYFIYGFPGETSNDLKGIGQTIEKILQNTRFKINVSLNLFMPKPFSRWETVPFCGLEKAKTKKKIVLSRIPRNKRIKVSFSDLEKNLIETILSRADNAIAPVLMQMQAKKNYLEEKNDFFNWQIWEKSLTANMVEWQKYLNGGKKEYPWSFIRQ